MAMTNLYRSYQPPTAAMVASVNSYAEPSTARRSLKFSKDFIGGRYFLGGALRLSLGPVRLRLKRIDNSEIDYIWPNVFHLIVNVVGKKQLTIAATNTCYNYFI